MSSCHFQQYAGIGNFQEIYDYLFDSTNNNKLGDQTWDDEDWTKSWDFNDEVPNADVEKEKNEDWMQLCCFALSPIGDFLCFAFRQKAVFIAAQKSGSMEKTELSICFKGSLNHDPSEAITSVMCLPLVSLKRTSHGSRDWTCTLVGFSSGYIRMYSETGGLLISELLHESPMLEFGCRTSDTSFNASYNGSAEHHDELTILYADALISMDGFSLFQTLRACRSQLAVATAQGSTMIDPPPLSYKKWVLRGQERISTHLNVGITSPTQFDQMRSVCILDGYNADVKSGTVAMNQFVAGGANPFLGFYYATEGSTQPFLSHVALAVASKLKSALYNAASGWLGWGQKSRADDQTKPKPKQKIEVGTVLDIQCGLPDVLRSVSSIILAPGANWLAAVVDSFGRVMLLDLLKMKAVRMWKGYRDAQIAFIRTSEEEDDSKSFKPLEDEKKKRMALFLVIYAPRRGILEVWSCINGPRVATFNIGKNAKLIYPGFGLFGFSNTKQSEQFNAKLIQCCLLENDGSIKQLTVPFHLALSDSKSSKARDVHLLKSLNAMLQSQSKGIDEATKLITSMRLATVQMQAVKKLLQSQMFESDVLKTFLSTIADHLKPEESKKEVKDLIEYLKSHISLLDLHMTIEKLNKISSRFDEEQLQMSMDEELSKELLMTNNESRKVIELLLEYKDSNPYLSQQDSSSMMSASDFLRSFEVNPHQSPKYRVFFENDKLISTLASYIFHSSLFSRILPADVIDAIKTNVDVTNEKLLHLVFECWKSNELHVMNNALESIRCLKRFVEALHDFDSDETEWREWIKNDVCCPSKSVSATYLLVLVCRSAEVAEKSEKVLPSADDQPPTYDEVVNDVKPPTATNTGWETLWPEVEDWNVLAKQCEDCIVVNTALCKASIDKNTSETSTKPSVNRVSVHDLLHNGPGYIPELIAEKICSLQIDPEMLFAIAKSDECPENGSQFLSYFRSKLVECFPTLLSSNSVHANCFWNEMVLWNRDPENISHFKKAIFHVSLITEDLLMQQGISLMAWRTFIVKKFIALAKLIEKVGKAPKDRLLRKETSMSEKCVPMFCRCCSQMLQVILDSNPEKAPPSQAAAAFDEQASGTLPDDTWLGTQGKESIANMGRDQPIANQALLQLNMYLAFIMDGVMAFSLRKVKPLTHLFNSTNRNHLMADLSTSNSALFHHDFVDPDITSHRKQFLFQVVRGSVKKLHEFFDDVTMRDETRDWVDTCVHMAAEFRIDYSLVRIQHVCELARHGLDEIVFDHLKATGNDEILAYHLLHVIGQRLNHILFTANPEDGARMTSQMPITLSSWIRAQDSKGLDVLNVGVESTLQIARELPYMLTEEHELHSLSEFLIEALSVVLDS